MSGQDRERRRRHDRLGNWLFGTLAWLIFVAFGALGLWVLWRSASLLVTGD